jgi:hypothetical protein
MSGVFDELNKKIGAQADDAGISPLDLVELPPKLRKFMRFMLREVEVKLDEMRAYLEEEFADEPFTDEELEEALETLVQGGWLIRLGEENITYEANLRRKRGSTLAKSIWGALDSRIEEQKKLREQARPADSQGDEGPQNAD